jgi:hypothetical protein
LKASRAIICGPTSVSIIPAILGLPLILAQYEQFKGQDYGVVLKSYPLSFTVCSVLQLTAALNVLNGCDHDKLREWISSYVEPLPATDMPKRVVDAINELTREGLNNPISGALQD